MNAARLWPSIEKDFVTITDLLNSGVPITARLTDASPTPHPLTLAGLVEASFPGYVPCLLQPTLLTPAINGMCFMNAVATWINNGDPGQVQATAIYITIESDPQQMAGYIPLGDKGLSTLDTGPFGWTINFLCYIAG